MRLKRSCTYCGLLYGTQVFFADGRSTILREEADHFFPRARAGDESDLISACQLCNQRKNMRSFDSLEDAKSFLQRRMAETIDKYISPLYETSEIPPKELKRAKEDEAHRVPELPQGKVDAHSVGEVLLPRVQGPVVQRAPKRCVSHERLIERYGRVSRCVHPRTDGKGRCFVCEQVGV